MRYSLKPIFPLLILILFSCAKEEEPTEELSKYQLQFVNNIGTPVSNPQGIASDQTNLWILSGELGML